MSMFAGGVTANDHAATDRCPELRKPGQETVRCPVLARKITTTRGVPADLTMKERL